MWVLEARKDAEVVWYSIVWEERKDASNVIDYDIHDEITTESSALFNANNQTTTGAATVIPWVNSPKLIYDTSIIWWMVNKTAYVDFSGWWGSSEWWDSSWQLRPLTISDQWWAYTYELWNYFNWYIETADSCIVIPASWVYMVTCTYYCTINTIKRSYDVYLNLDNIYHLQDDSYYWQHWDAYPTETFYINANKGDQFAIIWHLYNPSPWQPMGVSVSTNITKLS